MGPALVPRAPGWISDRQRRLDILRCPRTPIEYLRVARWWELEALRGHPSRADSARYARNMRWAAELATLFGPGTWLELIARSGHENPEARTSGTGARRSRARATGR